MNELLAIKSYWEGVKAVLGDKPPSKEQWKGICEKFGQIVVPATAGAAPKLAASNPEPDKPRPVMSRGAAMSAGP
jgi:hypothetical protein